MQTYIRIPYTIGLVMLMATGYVNAGEQDRLLMKAIHRNDERSAQMAIDSGAKIYMNNHWESTPLHFAIKEECPGIAKMLLHKKVNVNARDLDEETPLHLAAAEGYTDIVQLILDKGTDVDAQNHRQYTPLLIAAKSGHAEVVQLLLNNGADVNTQDVENETPLHHATKKGRTIVVQILVNNGADVNVKNKRYDTPLTIADIYNQTPILQLLNNINNLKHSKINQVITNDTSHKDTLYYIKAAIAQRVPWYAMRPYIDTSMHHDIVSHAATLYKHNASPNTALEYIDHIGFDYQTCKETMKPDQLNALQKAHHELALKQNMNNTGNNKLSDIDIITHE